jgi:hypothetical protein
MRWDAVVSYRQSTTVWTARSPLPPELAVGLREDVARLASPDAGTTAAASRVAALVEELVRTFAHDAGVDVELRFGLSSDEEDLYVRMSAARHFDPRGTLRQARRLIAAGDLGSVDIQHEDSATHVVAQHPWSASGTHPSL